MKIEDCKTFCNGTEHDLFMDNNCYKCKKYVYFQEATPENPVCPIEEKIHEAMFDESLFPKEHIKQKWTDDGRPYIPYCTEREGIE